MISVFHPNTLKDPELGPVVQKKIQDGSAVLSEPMCENCEEYTQIVNWVRTNSEWIEAALVFFTQSESSPTKRVGLWKILADMEKLPPISRMPVKEPT